MKTEFNNIHDIREKARMNIEQGPVTEGYQANRNTILQLLNEALATEIVCVLRYRHHYFVTKGINSEPIAQEFLEHATEELAHADKLAQRIVQLGGKPDFNPNTLTERSHAEYIEGADLNDMIRENLVAERIAIDSYREMIEYIGSTDPTTRRILEDILATEEEHADELSNLLAPE
jgi:bacterioferritin